MVVFLFFSYHNDARSDKHQIHSLSVVQLAFVDARCKFTVVDIASYGRNSDGGIFAHSNLGKYLETHLRPSGR